MLQPGGRVGSIIGERANSLRTPSKLRMGSTMAHAGLDMSEASLHSQAHVHAQASEALVVQTAAAQVGIHAGADSRPCKLCTVKRRLTL